MLRRKMKILSLLKIQSELSGILEKSKQEQEQTFPLNKFPRKREIRVKFWKKGKKTSQEKM